MATPVRPAPSPGRRIAHIGRSHRRPGRQSRAPPLALAALPAAHPSSTPRSPSLTRFAFALHTFRPLAWPHSLLPPVRLAQGSSSPVRFAPHPCPPAPACAALAGPVSARAAWVVPACPPAPVPPLPAAPPHLARQADAVRRDRREVPSFWPKTLRFTQLLEKRSALEQWRPGETYPLERRQDANQRKPWRFWPEIFFSGKKRQAPHRPRKK